MPVNADTIKEFCKDKIDDTNQYVELKQRKFAISGKASELDRTKDGAKAWVDKQIHRAEDDFNKKMQELGVDKEFTTAAVAKKSSNNTDKDSNGVDCTGCGSLAFCM
mmetsp:Transcript_772/g.1879  ORF Transcript_772/g.1879 Transcript_772/m.1879 type:complete len:107 (+) Transcript_772:75-395(+)